MWTRTTPSAQATTTPPPSCSSSCAPQWRGPREFTPPAFFYELIRSDQGTRRNNAGKFTELCSILLLLFAAVDDEVNQEETAYVDRCTRILAAAGLPAASPALRRPAPTPPRPEAKRPRPLRPPRPRRTGRRKRLRSRKKWRICWPNWTSCVGLEAGQKGRAEPDQPGAECARLRRENRPVRCRRMSLHLVFLGQSRAPARPRWPGCMARHLPQPSGISSKGQLVEADR